jgi:hypothetical protein
MLSRFLLGRTSGHRFRALDFCKPALLANKVAELVIDPLTSLHNKLSKDD